MQWLDLIRFECQSAGAMLTIRLDASHQVTPTGLRFAAPLSFGLDVVLLSACLSPASSFQGLLAAASILMAVLSWRFSVQIRDLAFAVQRDQPDLIVIREVVVDHAKAAALSLPRPASAHRSL